SLARGVHSHPVAAGAGVPKRITPCADGTGGHTGAHHRPAGGTLFLLSTSPPAALRPLVVGVLPVAPRVHDRGHVHAAESRGAAATRSPSAVRSPNRCASLAPRDERCGRAAGAAP